MGFLIDGYWKDDKARFTNHYVTEFEDGDDDDYVFYYGLSEQDIVDAINDGEQTSLEFVITSYTKID